jgi:hypothetical protein
MNGVQYALRTLHEAENDLVVQLLRVAETHRVEHEIHHIARDLAAWSRKHVALLADRAAQYDLDLDHDADHSSGVGTHVRQALSTMMGRRPEPGLLLLEDLRELYLGASNNSLRWEMLAQLSQAKRLADLLELSRQCHPETLRQVRWANTTLKIQSPQVLSSL